MIKIGESGRIWSGWSSFLKRAVYWLQQVEQRSIKVIRIKSLLIMVDYLSNYEKKVYQFNRSSHRRCTVKKGVVRNFVKFTGKHLCRGLFLIKLQAWGLQLYKKETPAQVFSCKFCKISKNTFFVQDLWATASDLTPSFFLWIFVSF